MRRSETEQRFRLHVRVWILHIFLQLARAQIAPHRDAALFLLFLEPGLDLRPRSRGFDPTQPVAVRIVIRRGANFNRVAVVQLIAQRYDAAIHFSADALMANIGVNGKGKVDWRGPAREGPYFAFWGEDVDFLRKHVDFDRLHKFDRIGEILLPGQQVTQPGKAAVGGILRRPFLVAPMSGNALFRRAMHVFGANLQLQPLALRPYHGGVERLVHIRLGERDVILEPAWDRFPQGVNDAQAGVTVRNRIGNHSDGQDIVDIFNGGLLPLHFLVNTVEIFRPPHKMALDVHFVQGVFNQRLGPSNQALSRLLSVHELFRQLRIHTRIDIPKGEIFELGFQPGNAKAIGEGGVNIQGFLANPALLVFGQVFQRAQVVQPVGKFDENHANVFGHGQNHLAKAFGLVLFAATEFELVEFRHPVH